MVPDVLDSGVYNPGAVKSSPAVKAASIIFLIFRYQHKTYLDIFSLKVLEVSSHVIILPFVCMYLITEFTPGL